MTECDMSLAISQQPHEGKSKVGNIKLDKMCWDVWTYLHTHIQYMRITETVYNSTIMLIPKRPKNYKIK